MPAVGWNAPLGQRQGGVFRFPPPYLWTPPTPQRNNCDRRQRRKQGAVVGTAASKTRVPPKARSGCWEPQPVSSGGHLKSSQLLQTAHLYQLLQKIAFSANLCLTTDRLSDIIEHVPAVRRRTNLSDHGPVAQLVRAPACHAGGRRFEPDPGRHLLL